MHESIQEHTQLTTTKFIPHINIPVTIEMHRKLKRKKKAGYTIAGYARAAIEKALCEDDQSIEEAG